MIRNPYIQHQCVTTKIDRGGKIERTLIIKSSANESSAEYKSLLQAAATFVRDSNEIDQVEISGSNEVSKRAPQDFQLQDGKAPIFANARS